MIIRFACKETEKIWRGSVSLKLPGNIQQVALRKLFMMDKAFVLSDLKIPRPPTGWKRLSVTGKANIASESMISGGFALSGQTAGPMRLKSSITH